MEGMEEELAIEVDTHTIIWHRERERRRGGRGEEKEGRRGGGEGRRGRERGRGEGREGGARG